MRCFYVICFLVCLVSCKAKCELASDKKEVLSSSLCPEEGICKLEVLKNKALQIKTDDFGKRYPEIINGKHLVLKFEYKKSTKQNNEDGGYREEFFIELDSNNPEIETANLKGNKAFFAKWCFCKGEAGYYEIDEGNLSVKKIDDQVYQIRLNFQTEEVTHILEKINQTFNLQ